MKHMKKIIAIVLIVSVVISGIHIGMKEADAENPMTVYGKGITATAGTEIKVPVLIKDNPGITGLALKVSYNADVMTPVKAEKGALLSSMSNVSYDDSISMHTGNAFECLAYGSGNFTENGELFILTFQMADSVSAGTYNLDFEMTECYSDIGDNDFKDVTSLCEKISILVEDKGTTPTPPSGEEKRVYAWQGEITGWGGPESYPSSAGHTQGSLDDSIYEGSSANIKFSKGYGCGLELMNPYNEWFVGDENEMAQIIKTMKNPRIKVTLKNGGAASSWNWSTELSFPSGVEMTLPDGYLDNGYFALFGNDDVITKVEIYDVTDSGQNVNSPTPSESQKPDQDVKSPNPSESQAPDQNVNPLNPSMVPGTSSATPAGIKTPRSTKTPSDVEDRDTHAKVKKPGKVVGVRAKAGKKRVVVSWRWVSNVSGFQIQCARNRGFSKGKKTKNAGKYRERITFKGLKSRKAYFVKVRAYRKSSGRKLYGRWSKIKKVRVK